MTENSENSPIDWVKLDKPLKPEDYADIPELSDTWFEQADLKVGDRLVRKGGRPRKKNPKQITTLRLDPDILAAFKATGKGWQTRLNDVLRANKPDGQ